MKIALIIFNYGVPLDDPCCYPLGPMYISAVLKKAGHDVTVYNLNLWGDDDVYPFFSGILDRQHYGEKSGAVLFTGFEEFLPNIKRYAALCKSRGIKTILGGALATYKAIEMLEIVDTVVTNEGEDVICQALNSTGIVKGTKPNLDNLPLPDYEGFGIEEYHKRHGIRYMGVLTSRGCPYSCKFCAQTCAFQFRKLSAVFEEIDLYKAKYGVELIVFNDNTLNLRKDRFMALCKGMEKRRLTWGGAIRADVWDNEIAKAAKDSGCYYMIVGVESFNQKKLNMMNKKIKVEQITQCLDSLIRHGIGYHANTLHGLPDETYEQIVKEVMEIPGKYERVMPGFVQPFVGTGYKSRSISTEQKGKLQRYFNQKITRNDMFLLPQVA